MRQNNPISRFINEISDDYIERIDSRSFDENLGSNVFKTSIDDSAEYQLGEKIVHDKFGEGIIVGIDKSILIIAFAHPHGIKKIMKGHSSIRKV